MTIKGTDGTITQTKHTPGSKTNKALGNNSTQAAKLQGTEGQRQGQGPVKGGWGRRIPWAKKNKLEKLQARAPCSKTHSLTIRK